MMNPRQRRLRQIERSNAGRRIEAMHDLGWTYKSLRFDMQQSEYMQHVCRSHYARSLVNPERYRLMVLL